MNPRFPMRRRLRRAFTLLEVMIAAGILVMTLAITARIQAAAVHGALRAERVVTGTDLAQEKISEVLILIETEGVGTADIHERGDFDQLGDEARLDYGDALDDYHWEYWVEEIEFAISSDAMAMAGMGGDDSEGLGQGVAESGMADQAMAALGFGPDQLSDQLGQYIRRVRVRVYWGDDDEAEEKGREVIITTHIISPTGAFQQLGGVEDSTQ